MEFSLDTCSAPDLSTHLVENRFAEEPSAAVEFLHTAWKSAIQKVNNDGADGDDDPAVENFQTTLLLSKPLETSILNPRMGKVSIQLGDGFLAEKQQSSSSNSLLSQQPQRLFLPRGSVSNLIVFPKPEDCKLIANNKKSDKQRIPKAHLVLLKLKEPIKFGKKETDQVCFQLPWDKKDGPTGPVLDDDSKCKDWNEATNAWRRVFVKAFKSDDEENEGGSPTMFVSQVRPTHAKPFMSHLDNSSSTTTSGMPFVKCNHGVEDGVLYPLEQGLLFFKPPLFLPRKNLDRIDMGRGASAGQSSSRYIDMNVWQKGNAPAIQFSNIQREEANSFNEYLQSVLIPAMKKDIEFSEKEGSNDEETDSEEENQTEEEMDEDDSSDDENFVEGEDDDSEDDEDSDDESGGIPVVVDEFAMKLARENQDESSTESEGEEGRASKRRRK